MASSFLRLQRERNGPGSLAWRGTPRAQRGALWQSFPRKAPLFEMASGEEDAPLLLALDDASPCTLLDVLAVGGIAPHLSELIDPSALAALASCSKECAAQLSDGRLWASLLAQHFGMTTAEANGLRDPRRTFAQRTVCARWSLAMPTPRRRRSSGAAPPLTPRTVVRKPPPIAQSSSWSPESEAENDKDGSPPRRRPALRRLQSNVDGEEASRASRPIMAACTVARLREGLKQLMLSGSEGLQACPVSPGDWSRWSARLACANDGSAVSGLEIELAMRYPADGSADGSAPDTSNGASHGTSHGTEDDEGGKFPTEAHEGLPRIRVRHPVGLFHPNVDATTGEVSVRALARRCSSVALVSEQLRAVAGLLRRPAFDVAPVNEEAAAMWFGERAVLSARLRARPAQRPAQRPSPIAAPLLTRGLTT